MGPSGDFLLRSAYAKAAAEQARGLASSAPDAAIRQRLHEYAADLEDEAENLAWLSNATVNS